MFRVEYAVYYNGRFAGWVDAGQLFEQRWDAAQYAFANGMEHEGHDFIISESFVPPLAAVIAAKVVEALKVR